MNTNRLRIATYSALLLAATACSDASTEGYASSESSITSKSGISATLTITSRWNNGLCAQATVKNTNASASTSTWSVELDVGALRTTSTWNGRFSADRGKIAVSSTESNGVLAPNAGTEFGFCVQGDVTTLPTVTDAKSDLPEMMPTNLEEGTYRLASTVDRLSLSATDGTLSATTYHGGASQRWRFEKQSNGAYALHLEGTDQCLMTGSPGVGLSSCSADSGRWTIETLRERTEDRPGRYRLHSSGNLCLKVNGTSAPYQTDCGNDATIWYIEPAGYAKRTTAELAEFRTLLIVKTTTNVSSPAINATIPRDNALAAMESFRDQVPVWFERMTDGQVRWTADAVISPRPLTRVRSAGGGAFWPYGSDIADDLAEYAPIGKYDNVVVYWNSGSVDGGWGLGYDASAETNHTGWSSANYNGMDLARDNLAWTNWGHEPTEVFIHEFLEAVTFLYAREGVSLPLPSKLHAGQDNQYANLQDGWKPWYRDYLLGTVITADDVYVGLGPRAYRKGTFRTLIPRN